MHKKYQLHASGNQPLLSYLTPGLVPFFVNKKFKNFSKAYKDTFPIFHGLHSVQKKSLESMSFKELPQHEQSYPEGLSVFAAFRHLRIRV